MSPDCEGEAGHSGKLQRRICNQSAGVEGGAPRVWAIRDRRGTTTHYAYFKRRISSHGGCSHSGFCLVRDLPHSENTGSRPRRERDRLASGTDAIPGMAAQQLSEPEQLPIVPHAGDTWAGAHHGGAGCAARWSAPAYICGGEFFHAEDAESVSQGLECSGTTHRDDRGLREDRGISAIGDCTRQHAQNRVGFARTPGTGAGTKFERSQAADGLPG